MLFANDKEGDGKIMGAGTEYRKTVHWDRANELRMEEILAMYEDGYEFIISDGYIEGIRVPAVEGRKM